MFIRRQKKTFLQERERRRENRDGQEGYRDIPEKISIKNEQVL
jgi:hypothetical protein